MKAKFYILGTTLAAIVFIIYVSSAGANSTSNIQNYSVIGTVDATSSSGLSISNQGASNGDTSANLSFSFASVEKIQSVDYVDLSAGDISAGDMIVAQGTVDGAAVTIIRIIDLSWKAMIATSTESLATTTESIATSTDSMATTSPEVASSTESVATSTDPVATSTDSVATTTETTSTDVAPVVVTDTASTTVSDNTSASSSVDVMPPPADVVPDASATDTEQ